MVRQRSIPEQPEHAEIQRLRDLALVDDLTGLANRRAFVDRVHEVFAAANAGGPLFSLVLLDLDGLKDINDTLGYQAGDRALQEFATALRASVRASDLAARFGGDEFAVVALHSSEEEAAALHARLEQMAAGIVSPLLDSNQAALLSASVGCSIWRPGATSVQDLFTEAETALISAKSAPRPTVPHEGVFRPRGRRALGEELRSLLAMARRVTGSSDINDLLRRTVEQAALLVGAQAANFAIVTPHGTLLSRQTLVDGTWHTAPFEVSLGEGLIGRAALLKEPRVFNHVRQEWVERVEIPFASRIRSGLIVPLRERGDSLVGLISLFNKRGRRPFLPADVELVQAFTDLAVSLMDTLRAHEAAEAAQSALRRANERLHALTEQAGDAIVRLDRDGRILDANAMAEQMIGAAVPLEGRHVTEFLADHSVRELARLRRDLRRGGLLRLTLHLRRAGGDTFPVEATVNVVNGEYLCIGRDVSERLRGEAATRQRTAELEARNQFAALLAESSSLEEGLHQILPVITRAAEMTGAVVLLGRTYNRLSLAAHFNLPAEVLSVIGTKSQQPDDPIRARLESGLPLIVSDVRELPAGLRPPHESIRGFVMLPLFSKGAFHGLLGIGAQEPIDPGQDQIARLHALANQLALWLENRSLLEAARRRERDAVFLLDFGRHLTESSDEAAMFARVVHEIGAYTGLATVVTLLDPDRRGWQISAHSAMDPERAQHLHEVIAAWPCDPDQGTWRIYATQTRSFRNTMLPANGARPDSAHRYGLHTPLLLGDELAGSLNLFSFHGDPRIGERHLSLARQAAQHISVALAKARAFAEAERHRAFLQAVMDHAAEAIIIAGESGRGLIDLNTAAEKLLGVPREHLLGTQAINIIAEADRPAAQQVIAAMKDQGTPRRRLPVRLQRGDGSTLPAEISASRVLLPSGPVFALLVRDRTPDLEAAREREALLQEAQDEALHATVLLDLAEQLTTVDSEVEIQQTALAACARLAPIGRGASLLWDEATGRFRMGQMLAIDHVNAEQIRHLSLDPAHKTHFAQVMRGDDVLVLEPNADLPLPNDSLRRLLNAGAVAMAPLRAGARFEGVLVVDAKHAGVSFSQRDLAILAGVARQTAIALDAAAQRRSADEARAYLDTVVQNAGDGVFVLDLAGMRLVDINEQLTSMLAYTRAEALAMAALEFIAPPERAQVQAALAAIDREPVSLEVPLIQRTGGQILAEIRGRMVLLGDRRLAVCTVRDLRHRAETERRLRFQADLLAGVRDAVVAIDLSSTITYWNAAAEQLTGWTAGDVIGGPPDRILRPVDRTIIQSQLHHLARTPGALDTLQLLHKDGHTVWVQFSAAPLHDPSGDLTGFACVARDITAQRAAEQRLRMFAQMTTGAGEAISLLGLDGAFQYANPAAHALLGFAPETLEGHAVAEIIDNERSIMSFEDVARTALGGKWEGNLRLRRADGRPIVVRAVLSPLPDAQGRPLGLIASGVDVTAEDAAQREQEQLLERLVVANQRASERSEELRAIADIGRIIVTGGEQNDVFQNLAQRILAAVSFDAVSISLYDAEHEELLFRAVDHRLLVPPQGMIARVGKRVSVAHSQVIPTVRRTLQPLVIHEPAHSSSLPALTVRALSSDGFRLGVFTPLFFNSSLVGMLGMYAMADREVGADELRLLAAMADQVAAAVDNLRSVTHMHDMRRDAIFRLALACEARDPETGAHLRQIQSLTEALARELGLPSHEVEELGLAAVLHDIGKITVPDAILTKPGRLTPEEYDVVRLHAGRGEEMLTGPDFYQTARRIARHHHERWDGGGYPDGLSGLIIPRDARIVAVADVYDALISPRVYKPAWPVEDAAREILRCAGSHFDPTVVAAFEALWKSDRLPILSSPPRIERAAS